MRSSRSLEGTKADVRDGLEWAVRALAQPPAVQRELFPSFVCVPDELVLEFDEHFRRVAESRMPLTPEQSAVLAHLDRLILEMSGPASAELWLDGALDSTPAWAAVRNAANAVLVTMGWSAESPGHTRATYVGPRSGT